MHMQTPQKKKNRGLFLITICDSIWEKPKPVFGYNIIAELVGQISAKTAGHL